MVKDDLIVGNITHKTTILYLLYSLTLPARLRKVRETKNLIGG